jgi:serine/threonine protein kinase/tetratricopeptide (TPR) repeat protein
MGAEENNSDQLDQREPFFSAFEGTSVERPGTQIGRYKLLSVLGEGGYGIVYLAEQERPMRRRVALKVIKPGMDSKEVLARFDSERQALALLDHAHIARVFTSGATDIGRPYFVMEYVEGMPITDYCDHHKLSIEDRLRLFQQVCYAVQHAHQKGIIHRDLKPSNILVSTQNDQPASKIIDFGVARATSQPLTDRTLYTEQGQMVGTPEYMSPEQADMAFEGIDTRSDVYSLGVVLYELLAGTLPFDPTTLRKKGADSIRRTIREQEPSTPSTRLSDLGDDAQKIAIKRSTEVSSLTKQLHRELEWIPLKAMRKDRTRRYKAASDLAQDVGNYLNGAPLLAGPESGIYRISKFIQRRWAVLTTALLVAAMLVGGTTVSTLMYLQSEKARSGEAAHRQIAEKERDRATVAEHELKRRIVEYYEQQGHQFLDTNSIDEALVFLDEAYQLDPNIFSLRVALNEAMRKWRFLHESEESALIPWRQGDLHIRPSGYATSPNRDLVALVSSSTDKVYVFETFKGVFTTQVSTSDVERMGFTPNANYLVLRSRPNGDRDYRLQVIELATGRVTVDLVLPDPKSSVAQLCKEETLYAHDLDQLNEFHDSLLLSRSGRWLAVPFIDLPSKSTHVYIIDIVSEKDPIRLTDYPKPALSMVFSSDEETFALRNYRRHRTLLWEVQSGKFKEATWSYLPILFRITSPDGQYRIREASQHEGHPLNHMRRGDEEVVSLEHSDWAGFSPSGTRFVTRQQGPIDPRTTKEYPPGIVWDTNSANPVADLSGPTLVNWHFTLDSGHLITEHAGGEMRLWNTMDGSLRHVSPADEGAAVVDISTDSRWMVTRGGITAPATRIWNLTTGEGAQWRTDPSPVSDLSHGLFTKHPDCSYRWSRKPPIYLPRFNADTTMLITVGGLQPVSFNVPSPEEVRAWIHSVTPLRLIEGRLRSVSDEDMFHAKLQYLILMKGINHADTISLRLELTNREFQQVLKDGDLTKASQLVTDVLSWLPKENTVLRERERQFRNDLSLAYFRRGRTSERRKNYVVAIDYYQTSIQFNKDNPQTYGRLAWLWATCSEPAIRSGTKAAETARKACQLTEWTDPHLLAILAAAHGEMGHFEEAVRYQEHAITLLTSEKSPRWRANFQKRLDLYSDGHAYDHREFWGLPIEDLVAWWKLDDGEGKAAVDASGNGFHGMLVGEPTWESGRLGGALHLDWSSQTDEYVKCGNSSMFDIRDAITLTGWVNVKSATPMSQPLIMKGSWELVLCRSSDRMRFSVAVSDGDADVRSTWASAKGRTGVEDGQWHHIVAVYDGECAYLYIDGILDAAVPAAGFIETDQFEVLIGQNPRMPLNRQWVGHIDDVRIYDCALSSEEVIQLFYFSEEPMNGAPVARTRSPLCFEWPEHKARIETMVIDDAYLHGLNSPSTSWSLLRGPGTVKFLPSNNIEDPCVLFPQPGAYELLLEVSDGEQNTKETLRVAIYPEDFDGLIAHYAFDDKALINKSSVANHNGRVVGEVAIVNDQKMGSVLGIKSGSYIDCGSNAWFDTCSMITIAVWFRVDAFCYWKQKIVSKEGSWYLRRFEDTNRIDFVANGVSVRGYKFDNVVSRRTVADGNWHHIVGVLDGKEMCLFIDGVLDASQSTPDEINSTSKPVLIGDDGTRAINPYVPSHSVVSRIPPDRPSYVFVDDVRIYHRGLNAEEVTHLYEERK